jgi:hypothetical protein
MNPEAFHPSPALSGAAAASVRAEVERIAHHPLFGHSRRYPAMLRYVVNRTLEGKDGELKERTVGIEGLGRPVSYDPSEDPIVRTTATEVRRRLALYYQETMGSDVRIQLPVGTYVPQFVFTDALEPPIDIRAHATPASARQGPRRKTLLIVSAISAPIIVMSAGLYLLKAAPQSAMERLWSPLLSGADTVGVCVGRAAIPQSASMELVTMDAANATSRVVAVLNRFGKSYEVRGAQAMNFADVRIHPLVAIGGFNNQWSLKITDDLRFHFQHTDTRHQIVDRFESKTQWERQLDRSKNPVAVVEDYAVVARVRDGASGQRVLVLAGLGNYGTSAAGEFVTSPDYLQKFAETAPTGWERRNIEFVIATRVQDGIAGPPRIVASHIWD